MLGITITLRGGFPSIARRTFSTASGFGLSRLLVGITRNFYGTTQFPVDLNRHRDDVVYQCRRIIFGPGGIRQQGFVAEFSPQLLGNMRRDRAEQLHDRLTTFAFHPLCLCRAGVELGDQVGQFADARDRAVEMEPFEVVGHAGDEFLDVAMRCFGGAEILRRRRVRRRQIGSGIVDQAPDPVQEPPCALDSGFGPFEVALRRAVREHIKPSGIGTVTVDDLGRVDDILLRFAHLFRTPDGNRRAGFAMYPGPVFMYHVGGEEPASVRIAVGLVTDHALRKQALKRFIRR